MSSLDYLDLCRLCLVKDRVSVPIFEGEGDVRQIFLKIAACLPVKVAREDKLPKKICDDCVYKVELFYQFWNTTANAEKQLLQWLGEVDIEDNVSGVLNTDVMKQEQSGENRLDGTVMQQVSSHQNNMGIGIMDNMGLGMPIIMSSNNQQQITSVPMDTSGSSVQLVQAVPGPSSQTSQDQANTSRHQDEEEDESEEEDNSDDECDGDQGLPVKEESEDDPGTSGRTLEPTTFVNVSVPCDEAGPSGLQQQKIVEMPEIAIPQTTDGDPKSGTWMGGKNIKQEVVEESDIKTEDIVIDCAPDIVGDVSGPDAPKGGGNEEPPEIVWQKEKSAVVYRRKLHKGQGHSSERRGCLPVACQFCKVKYREKYSLIKHYRRAHDVIAIECTDCCKTDPRSIYRVKVRKRQINKPVPEKTVSPVGEVQDSVDKVITSVAEGSNCESDEAQRQLVPVVLLSRVECTVTEETGVIEQGVINPDLNVLQVERCDVPEEIEVREETVVQNATETFLGTGTSLLDTHEEKSGTEEKTSDPEEPAHPICLESSVGYVETVKEEEGKFIVPHNLEPPDNEGNQDVDDGKVLVPAFDDSLHREEEFKEEVKRNALKPNTEKRDNSKSPPTIVTRSKVQKRRSVRKSALEQTALTRGIVKKKSQIVKKLAMSRRLTNRVKQVKEYNKDVGFSERLRGRKLGKSGMKVMSRKAIASKADGKDTGITTSSCKGTDVDVRASRDNETRKAEGKEEKISSAAVSSKPKRKRKKN